MRAFFITALLAMLFLASCKEAGKSTDTSTAAKPTTPAPPPAPSTSLNKESTEELLNLLSAYYSLKDALVAANSTKADESASKVLSAAESLSTVVGSQPQGTEIKPKLQTIMHQSDSIIAAKGADIEQQRTHFAGLSDAMYKVLRLANLKHAGVYRQYCPMAMNDAGAYWLSAESEIKNPYFGKKMLECGSTKDTL